MEKILYIIVLLGNLFLFIMYDVLRQFNYLKLYNILYDDQINFIKNLLPFINNLLYHIIYITVEYNFLLLVCEIE